MDKREYKEISELAAGGDINAFAQLYETLYREMYYTAYYSLADDSDAVDVVLSTARDTLSAIGRLRSEEAFRAFMMKTLCARIRTKFREHAAEERTPPPRRGDYDIRAEFARLEDADRLIASMYIGGRFQPDEISAYTGLSTSTIKKSLDRTLSGFELD
ncbi:MAG: RNA polymerase sigma factor [Oscillospiraceae bacterium]